MFRFFSILIYNHPIIFIFMSLFRNHFNSLFLFNDLWVFLQCTPFQEAAVSQSLLQIIILYDFNNIFKVSFSTCQQELWLIPSCSQTNINFSVMIYIFSSYVQIYIVNNKRNYLVQCLTSSLLVLVQVLVTMFRAWLAIFIRKSLSCFQVKSSMPN